MKAIDILKKVTLNDQLPGDPYFHSGAYVKLEMQAHFESAWYRGKSLEIEGNYLVVDVERYCNHLSKMYGNFIAEYGFDDEHFVIFEIEN